MVRKVYELLVAPYKYVYMMLNECSNYNGVEARRLSRTKHRSKKLFSKHNIPTAKGKAFVNPFTALKFVEEHGYPVVVKPNFGGYSRGSFFPIRNRKELLRASLLVKFYWPKAIVERYLLGKNYRIVVAYGKIVCATQRYPPFVEGDGVNSISRLIDEENKIRKEMKLNPDVIHPIEKTDEVINHLKDQKLNLRSVPKEGDRIYLHNKVALAPGGIVENFDPKRISKKNKEMFLKINKVFGADVFGIDAIFEDDISKDYDKQEAIILEVNSRPYLKMHLYPRYGKIVDVDGEIAKINKNE